MTYNKLIAAIVSTLLMRWVLKWADVDIDGLGVSDDFRTVVSLGIDAAAAAVNGLFVWWLPNHLRFRDWLTTEWAWIKSWFTKKVV